MRRTRFARPNTRQSNLVASSIIMASPAVAEGAQPRRYDYVETGTWALNPDGTASIDIGDDRHTVLTPFEFALLGQDLYRLISHENYVSSLSGLLISFVLFSGGPSGPNGPQTPQVSAWNLRFQTNSLGDYSGYSVAPAGDINGDGFADVLISVPQADLGTNANVGFASLVFGEPADNDLDQIVTLDALNPPPIAVNFSDLGGSNDALWGWSTAGVGDLNADGFDDFLISKNANDSQLTIAHLIFGYDTADVPAGLIDLSNSSVETAGLANVASTGFDSLAIRAAAGFHNIAVSAAGDVDSDGIADILVGREYSSLSSGSEINGYILFGDYLASLNSPLDLSFSQTSPLPSHVGVEIMQSPFEETTGSVIASAGQARTVDYDDVLIGVPDSDSSRGATYLIFGQYIASQPTRVDLIAFVDPNIDPTDIGQRLIGETGGDAFGYALSTAGDIDGDGFDEVLVGAPGAASDTGATYLLHSSFLRGQSSDVEVGSLGFDLNGQPEGIKITGRALDDRSGAAVSTAGDVDNDGIPDILIGAPGADGTKGEAYLIFGSYLAVAGLTIEIDNLGVDLNGRPNGVIFTGVNPNGYTGISVASAGDMNADGYDDILIGGAAFARRTDPPLSESYMLSGYDIVQRADVSTTGPLIINLSTDYDWV